MFFKRPILTTSPSLGQFKSLHTMPLREQRPSLLTRGLRRLVGLYSSPDLEQNLHGHSGASQGSC